MHIIIAFLTAVGTILYFLDKAKIDIGWLNPWAWSHRRKWRQKLQANPAFSIESPMESIALLLTAIAKIDGDLSVEEKSTLLEMFESTFQLSASDAASLLGSSTYLLRENDEIFETPAEVLTRSLPGFSSSQKTSSVALLNRLAAMGDGSSEKQRVFIEKIEDVFFECQQKESW